MTQTPPDLDYDAQRSRRLATLTAPGGSLSMVAMPVIPTTPRTFEGVPGTWIHPEGADGISVTATTEDKLQIDDHRLSGTEIVGPESSLRFSETVTARVGHEVDGTWYLHVSDTHSPNLAAFECLGTYDIDPDWVIAAHYFSHADDNRPMMTGRHNSEGQHQRNSPGDLELTVGGHTHRLAVYSVFMPGWVTLNFTDETSGKQTPAAGRILAMPRPMDGPVMLDFNQSMLLPYEASSVYPCPMPPRGNHLPVAVTAGERKMCFGD